MTTRMASMRSGYTGVTVACSRIGSPPHSTLLFPTFHHSLPLLVAELHTRAFLESRFLLYPFYTSRFDLFILICIFIRLLGLRQFPVQAVLRLQQAQDAMT
jgi:hypothetical protein